MTGARAIAAALVAGIAIVSAVPAHAAIRTYFIAADDVIWNYAPSGHDLMSGTVLRSVQAPQLGWLYHEALYRAYTDVTFRHLKPRGIVHAHSDA